ncbi:MCE family protein [Mycolicibacterium pallens]|uniref:MCE family protein n=1 Tax=Mycolicibacterium pallens TaxID=370524 RepID=A0ABX8VPW1_9MYCO|nr:MCE family protein [Mycolicibacterium pallens]QYL17810.1 MCE family protein [Mycolicibacterium pallens]
MSARARLLAVVTVVVVAAASAITVALVYFKSAGDHITLTAQFDSAAGLYVDNTVAVLGMPVGKVTAITPKSGYVEVQFTVDRDVKIPADAQAVTISTSILTDRQIELTPPYRGGPILRDRDTIGLPRTKTPVEFARVLGVLDKISVSLKGDGKGNGPVADVVNSGAAIADGNGQKIKDALGELSNALRLSADGGAQTRDQLTTIVRNLSSLLQAAADNDATLRDFGATVRQLSQIVNDEDFGSGTTGKTMNTLLTQVGDFLEKNRDNIKAVVNNGNTTANTLVERQRDLKEFIDVAPLTLDNLYNVVDRNNGVARARVLTDRVLFDNQATKELCNLMGLRQLGCSTGTLQDFGPDFGLSYVLDGMAAMGQK